MSEDPSPEESEKVVDFEPFPRADDFTSDFATRFSVGYSDDRTFVVDFRAPDIRAFPGNRQSMGGELQSVSQVQMPPHAMKQLQYVLTQKIAEYEEDFGEIELDLDSGMVYGVADDSELLARAAIDAVSPSSLVLDVGTGSGYVASEIAETGASVVGTDVNPHACQHAEENGIPAVRGDLVEPFRDDTFDVIAFNPPYLPSDGDDDREDWMDVALYGGADGRRVLDPFVDSVGRVLAPDGTVLVVLSTLTGVDAVRERARANGFRTETVAQRGEAYGKVLVLQLRRAD